MSRPLVVVDATSISPTGKGLARVQRQAVRGLAEIGRHDLLVYAAADVDLAVRTVRVRRRPALVHEQVRLARAARRADVVLTWTDRLPLVGQGRFVVWLFELPTRRIAQNRAVGAGAYQRVSDVLTEALWRRSLRRASAIVAGSRATAAEIAQELPDARPVHVVYPGLDDGFTPGPGREGRYVFHLGSSDPRDNTASVIESVAQANRRLADPVTLVVAGAKLPGEHAHVEALGRVTDEELVQLYRGASAYLDASLYEGFGYQPLEAMACGAPVIVSDAPSVEEVVGDAGLVCPAHDVDARAELLVRVLEQPQVADRMRRRGLERASEFTWERTAHSLAGVLDEVIG
jgi:glycosyltransferase involved in cell wall biosynthesis